MALSLGALRDAKVLVFERPARGAMSVVNHIESRPGVAGGAACIARTRIPVWVLEQARRLGAREADILRAYPALRAEDLANAWAYVRLHRDEIDREIEENESA
jgi:uncharacterized protein (DUF433 family)